MHLAREDLKMCRVPFFGFLICSLGWFTSIAPIASADNGTVISGTVIGIDSVNQVMRVYVTAVNGQPLYGSPQTNYVDYVVVPNTVVVGRNNQFLSQSNVLVGSQIQMQFAGPLASTIVLTGNYNNGGFVSFPSVGRNFSSNFSSNFGSNFGSTFVQSYVPIQRHAVQHIAYSIPIQHHVQTHHVNHPTHSTLHTGNLHLHGHSIHH